MSDPFHPGEREVQERAGERDRALRHGQLIGRSIPPGAISFLTQQQYCVLGWVASGGDIWASFLTGRQGFASSDEAGATLLLDLDGTVGLPASGGMRDGDGLGVLFIDLATRRRLRVNGRITGLSGERLLLSVAEAFPNCPKYIQRREVALHPAAPNPAPILQGEGMNDDVAAWIVAADTFFVASAHPGGLVDTSHRGGKPGFVKLQDGVLRIPDYPGNSMFGTLGNFAVNPRAGLVFVDFPNNRQLQLTGDVELDFGNGDRVADTGGTGRWWQFSPRRWQISPLVSRFHWGAPDASPFNP